MPNNEEEFLDETEKVEETTEIKEENEPVKEEPASVNPTIIEDNTNEIKKEIRKKALAFLLKNPYILLILGALILVIIIIVLIYGIDFYLVGTGDTTSNHYEYSCQSINLVWENEEYIKEQKEAGTYRAVTSPEEVDLTNNERFSYQNYELDAYITGIVWNENNAAGDLDNEIVYQLMAIATRSRIVTTVSDKCIVLRDYNPEKFVELSGNEDNYSEIRKAVSASAGIIIGKDNNIINAKYDVFSYTKKYKSNDESYKDKGSYYMMNTNEEGQQIIPASWVVENEVPVPLLPVAEKKYLESLSLYGSKYLLEKTDSQYDLYRVLQYYYGNDIEFYTLGVGVNAICSAIDFYKTSLSREEFVLRATSYLQSKSSTTAKLFRENAGKIYDLGLEIGANPEMVYLIAHKEQGWKDTEFTVASYNFYGYGVYNGKNSGKYFDSFEDGVITILNYVKNKGNLDSFVKVYSYLGTYLANPGSWGDGGCIYLTLEEIYGPDYSRCNSSYKCASSNGGPGCVETTETEKQAYIDWQAKKILEYRKTIFNLDGDSCAGSFEGSTEGTTFLHEAISTFLTSQGTTLEAYNDTVLSQGCKYQGTGSGVASVAATAVSELAKYGKKFHYNWGGMHANVPSSFGVPSDWGPNSTGPDCSGFVNWALYNAGFTWISKSATDWGNAGTLVNLNDDRIQIGDLIVTPGKSGFSHVVIISAIHRDEGYYTVVEANGTKAGVIFKEIKIEGSSRKAVLMSDYYETAAKSTTFSSMCTTKGIS